MTGGYPWFYSIILPLQPKVIPNAICGICQKGKEANKKGKPEALIHCSQCDNSGKFTLLILKFTSLFSLVEASLCQTSPLEWKNWHK